MAKEVGKMREDATAIFQAGLQVVAPGAAIKKYCHRIGDSLWVDGEEYDLTQYNRVLVLGAGKAGASMAGAVEELLLDKIDDGLVVVKYDHLQPLEKIRTMEAAHPVPDENGLAAAKALYTFAESAGVDTLVICVISGGGSALMPLPVESVSLADKQKTTALLLGCGADIHEINTIRKHLSKIKGGGLASALYPSTVVCLILSDVVGDDIDSIASGPCVKDATTFIDCRYILKKYALESRVPESVERYLAKGAKRGATAGEEIEDVVFEKVKTVIVGCNYEALKASKEKAVQLGYNTLLLSSLIEGETRDSAAFHMAIAREVCQHDEPVAKPACLISGGETTVTLTGGGKGGRNQEFVLAAGAKERDMKNTVVLSAGTDGTDGPTDAAGAIWDSTSLGRAKDAGLSPKDYLNRNDSYHFFQSLNDLYKTGPTNTNVMDVRIILIGGESLKRNKKTL